MCTITVRDDGDDNKVRVRQKERDREREEEGKSKWKRRGKPTTTFYVKLFVDAHILKIITN